MITGFLFGLIVGTMFGAILATFIKILRKAVGP